MPLELPSLDNRTFEQILRDLQLRVPVYSPEWTDFNDSDPGTTLLQLFAWLAEALHYRMNQVPERSYVKFLQLLGLDLRPALPATAHLTFSVTPGQAPGTVKKGTQVAGQPPEGDPLVFETERDLDLLLAELGEMRVFESGGFQDVKPANDSDNTPFRPFGFTPVAGNALYLGFVPPPKPLTVRIFPRQMRFRAFLPASALNGKPQSSEQTKGRVAPPIKLIWEYRPNNTTTFWQRLNVLDDESAAFTREGYLSIEGPAKIEPSSEANVKEMRYWIRVRIADTPADTGRAPILDRLLPNTVEARNLSTVREEVLDSSDGTPDQIFTVRKKPVLVEAANKSNPLGLATELDDVTTPWTRVDDFLASGPDDPHYMLNPAKGEIRFGSGRRGKIPQPGALIVAKEYRYGGGSAGNLGPDTLQTLLTGLPGVQGVTNARAAAGGSAEQELQDLQERAPQILKRGGRAVTVDDFQSAALEIGGVKKARAMERTNPRFPGADVPGSVTVVIVPDSNEKKPEPSGDLIRAVASHLDQYRLVATEVWVTGPQFQAVRVEVQVEAPANASFDQIATNVAEKLDEFLSPLKRNFGEDLIPTQLFNVVQSVDSSISVQQMNVYVDGRLVNITQRIPVPLDGLLYPEPHIVSVVPKGDV